MSIVVSDKTTALGRAVERCLNEPSSTLIVYQRGDDWTTRNTKASHPIGFVRRYSAKASETDVVISTVSGR